MRTPAIHVGVGVLALALVGGCSSGRYIYRPEQNATARVAGRPAALYSIPPQSPHGEVRVATLGIATLEPRGDDEEHMRTMHVRMVVANNNGTSAWRVDTRQQEGILDQFGRSRPAFASASAGSPPLIDVPPGTSVTIDLYYPLPEAMQHASNIPQFDVLWNVQTTQGAVVERTSFERLELEPEPANGFYAGGWWGPPWYDPLWGSYAFWGAPIMPPLYIERPIVRVGPRGFHRR